MQDKDLYIKFICSNLHIQNIFHTSKTIHKMKFFQISIVKSIYWLKKKDHNLIQCIPNCQKKSWKKIEGKNLNMLYIPIVPQIYTQLLHKGNYQGLVLAIFQTCLPLFSDEPVTVSKYFGQTQQFHVALIKLSSFSLGQVHLVLILYTESVIINKNTLIPKCNQIYSIFPTILKLIQK